MNDSKSVEMLQELIDISRYQILGEDKVLQFTFLDNEIKMYLPYAHTDLIQRTILRYRTFFENYLLLEVHKFIEPGATIADIGANIGNHTVFFGACCKAKEVIAFEPLQTAFSLLTKNVEINNLDNVTAHNAAAGINGDKLELIRCTPTNLGGSQFQSSELGDYPVISLDSLELKALDFIKLDVEGLQSPVLEGAHHTLASLKPNVLVEVLEGEEETLEAFKKMGYIIKQKIGKTDYLLEGKGGSKWV